MKTISFFLCKIIDLAKANRLNIKYPPAKAGGNSKVGDNSKAGGNSKLLKIVAIHNGDSLKAIELF